MLVGQIIGKKYIDPINSRIKKRTNTFGAIKKGKKRKYIKAIASSVLRNPEEIKKVLCNYKMTQNYWEQMINEHEAKILQSRLIQISKTGGTNSKSFHNLSENISRTK